MLQFETIETAVVCFSSASVCAVQVYVHSGCYHDQYNTRSNMQLLAEGTRAV